ncbi:MAG: indole-3-glycerol phosphate synthase TrpC [Bacilli bacterium]
MTILDRILETKRAEVTLLRSELGRSQLLEQAAAGPPVRPFAAALRERVPVALIAEIKKASPSKGVIAASFDPVNTAVAYEAAGASALSVLTDRTYFQGSSDILKAVRAATGLPILRKDFIIDELQVLEARAMGADAILLIAAALSDESLQELYTLATDWGMAVLVEIHSVDEWRRAAPLRPQIVGVNHRDLRTFDVDLSLTETLAAAIDQDVILVGESGIKTASDVDRLRQAGAHAILVGETLMRFGVGRIGEGVAQLLGSRRN